MNNLILWIGLIIAFLLLTYFYYKKREQLKINLEKKKKASYALDKNEMENFIQEAFRHLNMKNNLIDNGTFEHGEDANDTVQTSIYGNKILAYENPSPYNYLLYQTITPTDDLDKVFYTIAVNIEPSQIYVLEFIDNTNSNEDSGIVINTKNKFNETINIPTKFEIKEVRNFKNKKWVYVHHIFTVPPESNKTLNITFETLKNSEETIYRYLGNINLRKYLPLVPNFEITRDLQVYLNLNPSSLQINKKYWRNLAGNRGNFIIEGESEFIKSGIYTKKLMMETTNASNINISPLINNNDFTLIFVLGSLPNNLIVKEDLEYNSLQMPGNQNMGFSIKIPNYYGPIELLVADEEFKTDKNIEPNIGCILSFVYTNKTLEIYLNQILLEKIKTKQVYFNKESILLNTTGNWSANLQNLLIYNNALLQEDIVNIVNWFQNNNVSISKSPADNQSNTTASIQGYTMSSCIGDDCGCSNISNDWAYTSNADPKYNEKLNNLRKCYLNKLKCPTAQYVSGDYKITIPEKSLYAMEYNSYGVKNYGSDKTKARELYNENFPLCLVPDVLSNSHKIILGFSTIFVISSNKLSLRSKNRLFFFDNLFNSLTINSFLLF